MMRVGIAADHGGFALKVQLVAALQAARYEVAGYVKENHRISTAVHICP